MMEGNKEIKLKGNKGEWSEVYALLKILGDGKIATGDENLNKIEHLIFPVLKVLREETEGSFEFSYDKNIVLVKNNDKVFKISISSFKEEAKNLLTKIKNETKTTFEIPETEFFLNSFNSKSIKAQSTIKSDIRIVIHDQRTGDNPELGFSIKSKLGSASTLLNAGKTTNFIYKIEKDNLNQDQIRKINAIESRSKIKDRLEKLKEVNACLRFEKLGNTIFSNNLVLIDSNLPKILSEMLVLFYSTKISNVSDLVVELTKKNPLRYNTENNHPFYEYKIKRFLTDIALGMMPSIVWTGNLDATGGYLIVKEDGEIICYHIYNRNEFENYLFNNTKLETASSSRHKFGIVYEDNGKQYFALNLQIRFL